MFDRKSVVLSFFLGGVCDDVPFLIFHRRAPVVINVC